MDEALRKKCDALKSGLEAMGSVAVAFSAGVDSTFLLHVAHETLGKQALAVTVRHCALPEREFDAAAAFCRERGIRHAIVDVDVFSVSGFAENPPDRCYWCKCAIFKALIDRAAKEGFTHVAEGSNLDDDGDYRPGRRALSELGVLSPLHAARLTKADIRVASRAFSLPTWDKPNLVRAARAGFRLCFTRPRRLQNREHE